MYKRLLVPLDGSQLSECSLTHVEAIANGCHVPEVILLRVVEPLEPEELNDTGPQPTVLKKTVDIILKHQDEAKRYLGKVSDMLKKSDLQTRTALVSGNPEEEILEYSTRNEIDLIILTTHGRSGVSRWFFGSVADRVARHSRIPVLIVSPPGCRIRQAQDLTPVQ